MNNHHNEKRRPIIKQAQSICSGLELIKETVVLLGNIDSKFFSVIIYRDTY